MLVEAGHRCAIPTCRATTIEIAHIEPWSKVKKHEFHNLIVLCPNCHTAFDTGKIDQLAMKQYKANLAVVVSRYGDLERRVLALFARSEETVIELPGGNDLLLSYLIQDGLLVKLPRAGARIEIGSWTPQERYLLTPAGQEFVQRWVKAKDLN